MIMGKQPVGSPRAWRVRLRAPISEGDFDCLIRDCPRPLVAEREELDHEEALTAIDAKDSDGAFTIVWVPPGADEFEIRAENWIGAPPSLLHASISTIRALWSSDRSAYFCAGELSESGYDAIVRFTAILREVESLKKQVAASWQTINEHLHLARRDVSRAKQSEIGAATEKVLQANIALLNTQTSLEQLDPELDSPSKRLCAELILAANLHDRLEMLEGPVEFASNQYEAIASRLNENNNARRERWLEAAIIALLLVNTAAMFTGSEKDHAVEAEQTERAPQALTQKGTGPETAAPIERAKKQAATDRGSRSASGGETVAPPASTAAVGAPAGSPASPESAELDATACRTRLNSLRANAKIGFSGATALLPAPSLKALGKAAEALKRCKDVTVEVRAAGAGRATAEVERRRANAVISALVRAGVNASALTSAAPETAKPSKGNVAPAETVGFGAVDFVVRSKDAGG
jgi:outer membrane protein OmpA-like peptidoglycan-associated protein